MTGHTGFKGTWMSLVLSMLGAEVYGYALEPEEEDALFNTIKADEIIHSEIGDVRDREHLLECFDTVKPEFVFHLAAQPLVRKSYEEPVLTFEINVMGTVNICECVRRSDSVKSFLNVTTDKVYLDNNGDRGYIESDPLDGFDPYANSKSCSELVTHSYYKSFLKEKGVAVSTARAGNVIGGGDFAKDRIIPDCARASMKGEPIFVRNPHMIRPFQHVLDPLYAYLMIAAKQYDDVTFSGSYNVGPDDEDCVTVEKLVTLFCESWGDGASWTTGKEGGPHESNYLKLDCALLKKTFDWKPLMNIEEAIGKTVEWYKLFSEGKDDLELRSLMERQVGECIKWV